MAVTGTDVPIVHIHIPHNQEFWIEKFGKNIARDKRTIEPLQRLGWQTFVIWECEVKKDTSKIADALAKVINRITQ